MVDRQAAEGEGAPWFTHTRPARIRWLVLAALAALSLTLTSPIASADDVVDDEVTAYCQGTVYLYGIDPLVTEPSAFDWFMYAPCAAPVNFGNGSFGATITASGSGVGSCLSFDANGQGTMAWDFWDSDIDNIVLQHEAPQLSMQFDHDFFWHSEPGTGDLIGLTHGVCEGLGRDVSLGFSGVLTLSREDLEGAGVVDLEDPDRARPSKVCETSGGDRLVDNTVLGVRQWVYVHQPTADELWVCARVEDDTGEGYGGRLDVTPTGLDPQVTGGVAEPEVDGASDECTDASGNDAPGTRPIAFGGVGPVDYMLDAFLDGDEAWLCLQVGDTDTRVVVPLGGETPGVSFGSVATWWPDDGTPTF